MWNSSDVASGCGSFGVSNRVLSSAVEQDQKISVSDGPTALSDDVRTPVVAAVSDGPAVVCAGTATVSAGTFSSADDTAVVGEWRASSAGGPDVSDVEDVPDVSDVEDVPEVSDVEDVPEFDVEDVPDVASDTVFVSVLPSSA